MAHLGKVCNNCRYMNKKFRCRIKLQRDGISKVNPLESCTFYKKKG